MLKVKLQKLRSFRLTAKILISTAILTALNLVASVPASAQTRTFEWDYDPTAATTLSKYKFYRDGSLRANINSPGVGQAPPQKYSESIILGAGDHTYYVTAVDRLNRESAPSNVLTITIGVPTPTPTSTPTPTRTPIPQLMVPERLRQTQ